MQVKSEMYLSNDQNFLQLSQTYLQVCNEIIARKRNSLYPFTFIFDDNTKTQVDNYS